jgi:NAD(P)-dependent dehydrogenase (short-subunit alcohol dehydrogenase family)
MTTMDGTVVLITGAKGGLGRFVTERFLDAGATVVGTSRSIKQSDFTSDRFTAMPADFSSGAAVRELANRVVSRFGKIDALIHVMGGFAGGPSVAETDDKTWEQMRDLNLTSAFYITRAVIPHMRKAKYGRIVAVGSLAAVEPHAGLGAYVVFKAAMATLIRTLALENADANITANVVLPGTMDTPGNRASMPNADFSKWVQPKDVASLILYLAEEQAAQITGAVIPIQGR